MTPPLQPGSGSAILMAQAVFGRGKEVDVLKTLGTARRSTALSRAPLAPRTTDRITPRQMRELDARIDRALAATIKLRDDIQKVGRK